MTREIQLADGLRYDNFPRLNALNELHVVVQMALKPRGGSPQGRRGLLRWWEGAVPESVETHRLDLPDDDWRVVFLFASRKGLAPHPFL